jgi:hypothetical protein
MSGSTSKQPSNGAPFRDGWYVAVCSLAAAAVFFYSNPKPQHYYDYTYRVAENLLRGSIGFTTRQPSWLNEFVPFEGFYYSVFPLGSVVSMLPFAFLKVIGAIKDMPAALIAALLAAGMCVFLFLIARKYAVTNTRSILMAFGILLGTWTWTNLTMGGAWQLALGFAMFGTLGAIYFTVYDRRPILAGIFFALAFGNRTEVLLTAPILMYLLIREGPGGHEAVQAGSLDETGKTWHGLTKTKIRTVAAFCIVPFILGVATLIYNYVRFHSIADFGYARIPGVLNEPWYRYGIFSVWYIPGQVWEMLWRPWETRPGFPYLVPNPFSSSILWSSPFLLFAARFGARDRDLKYLAWTAVFVVCVILWMHGNSGGWQFGYRYAMVCLPWMFVIMLESAPSRISPLEWAAYIFSFAANAYATWLFHWTSYLRP